MMKYKCSLESLHDEYSINFFRFILALYPKIFIAAIVLNVYYSLKKLHEVEQFYLMIYIGSLIILYFRPFSRTSSQCNQLQKIWEDIALIFQKLRKTCYKNYESHFLLYMHEYCYFRFLLRIVSNICFLTMLQYIHTYINIL